jgi:hypothetical protein
MITLKDYIEAIEYRITEGSEYTWKCFGPNARYLDSHGPDLNQDYSISAVFDSMDQTVYCVDAWDYRTNRTYRWINPNYINAVKAESKKNNIDFYESYDGEKYIDIDVEEDILEKINAIVNGKEYDSRVKVPVVFSDQELLQYMKLAHEMDITFNELVERAIQEAIDSFERDPKKFKKSVDNYLEEKNELSTDGC